MRQLFRSKFKITQEFGVNEAYYKQFGLKGHEGIDLIPTGSVWDIMALEDGVVVKDEDNPLSGVYGIYCTIFHPKINKATQSCHLKENYVENGQLVKRGDKIGLMGKTGNTTGAHVHLNLYETDTNGIRLNKNNGFNGGIDPLPFLMEDVEPVETTALDECRKQVEKEIKNKNETYQELVDTKNDLEAANSENLTHQNYIKQLAITLGVEADTAKILGQITKLLSEEDQLRQALSKIEELQKEAFSLKEELKQADETINKTADELSTVKEASQDVSRQLEQEGKLLQECQTSQKFEVITRIFGIYLCKEKEVVKNGKED